MKTLKSLVTLLMVMLSVGLCSCSKEFIEVQPIGTIGGESMENPFKIYLGEDYENITHLNFNSVKDDTLTIAISGLKNKHYWLAYFNRSSKKKNYEWEDIEETDTIQKIYTGYGEYKEIRIGCIGLMYHQKTMVGDIVGFLFSEEPLSSEVFYQTIFTSNGKFKRTKIEKVEYKIYCYDWYDESVFINNCCYSKEGEAIYSIKDSYLLKNIEPVSYEEGVKFNYSEISFERLNIKENKSVWKTILKDVEIPFNAKVSYSILDKSANIWKCKLDAILYDGTKQSYIFTVNIEDGKVNVVEEGVKVTGVTLNKSKVTLDLGGTYQLVDTVKPIHAENQKVVWTSSNESVATVDQNGLVTAKSYGESMITATTEDGGFTATANVTVKAREISDYITSKLNVAVVNLGGYIQCTINCELVNDSKDDIELTAYTILDENEKVLLTKSYDHTLLGAKSSYTEGAYVRGTFSELILRWTYVHKGKEYTYTTKYKVKNS